MRKTKIICTIGPATADEKTMMDNALSQYRNKDDPNYSGAYKAAVDIMEIAYEGDDYTTLYS